MDTLQQPNLESPAEAIQLLPLSLKNRRLLGAAFLAAILFSLVLPLTANADPAAPKRQFHIPAGTLSDALLQFSETSDQKVLFNADLVQGFRTEGLDGTYTSGQALQRLLDGSGLSARETATGSITLEKRPRLMKVDDTSQSEKQLPIDDTTLPKVTVEADSGYDPDWAKDPYNPDYVLPNATSGTKTDTPVMETPLNVQSISKQALKDQQVITLDQALKNVSGVTTSTGNNGDTNLFLRGFQTQTTFRNGFRMDAPGLFIPNGQQFANVESVEVLKGPAAILYGRVEPGGMVNIITKQPRATPYYSLNQQFGSYDLYRTSIDATGPLTKDDTLLYRMNASFQSNNTFQDLVKNEDVFLAPIFRWNISPRTQATLEMEYQHQKTNLGQQVLPLVDNHIVDSIPHHVNLGESNPQEYENIFAGFNWSHQFNDDWSVKHMVNFKRQEQLPNILYFPQLFTNDFSGNPVPTGQLGRTVFASNSRVDTIATDLNLTGHFKTWGLGHTLLLGGDYYNLDLLAGQKNTLGFVNSFININNPTHPGTSAPIDPSSKNTFASNTDNFGLYAQDQIKLLYHVHVTGGLRYQYVHSTTKFGDPNDVFRSDPGAPPQTDDAVTPRVGILWNPEKWLSLYSNYAENFGANTGSFGFGGKLLPPQSAQQWEVGAKTELFDGRLRATFAYYDLTKQNVATTDPNHLTQCFGGPCSVAVGAVNSHGPELDIQGEILPGWNVIATYTNQDVRVTKSNGDLAGTAFQVGNRLQWVPRNIGTVWTTYEMLQGDLKGFKLGGGVRMQDGIVDASNTVKAPGYAVIGLMAGYSFNVDKAKITAQLNVENLLDKSYFTNPLPNFGVGSSFVQFSTPRTFMGSINVQY